MPGQMLGHWAVLFCKLIERGLVHRPVISRVLECDLIIAPKFDREFDEQRERRVLGWVHQACLECYGHGF